MNFGEQIKKIRKDRNLTQQEMADKIGVSRQAVSNWENDKNLPDIAMLITMAQVFHLTLDELILGGAHMNNMTDKLIKDGSENHRVKMNLVGIKIGFILLLLGFLSLIAGIWVPISMEGYCGSAFTIMMFCGTLTFLVVGLKNVVDMLGSKGKGQRAVKWMAAGGILVALGSALYVISWFANTTIDLSFWGIWGIVVGIMVICVGSILQKK